MSLLEKLLKKFQSQLSDTEEDESNQASPLEILSCRVAEQDLTGTCDHEGWHAYSHPINKSSTLLGFATTSNLTGLFARRTTTP